LKRQPKAIYSPRVLRDRDVDRYGKMEIQIYTFTSALNGGASSAPHPRECGRYSCG